MALMNPPRLPQFAGRGMENLLSRQGSSLGETRPRGRVSPRRRPQRHKPSSTVQVLCWLFPSLLILTGCAHWGGSAALPSAFPSAAVLANPMTVGPMDEEFLWNQLVDTVDDYFKIEREVRMRSDGGVVTDGLIQTFPTPGATFLEPWRHDSTPGFEKLHASLQSIRRRATIRVSPSVGGYSIELIVYKELEDVAQPEHATVGALTLRHDGSLVRNEPNALEGPPRLGWIPEGRDMALEQRMLAELGGRLAEPPAMQRLPGLAP
jgi:hypothetical protein